MRRRELLLAWTASPAVWAATRAVEPANAPQADAAPERATEPTGLLRRDGVAVLLRHAATDPGIGDPPGFQPGVCSTQRNLSAAGRAQARQIGAWFRDRGLQPTAVRSSAWCRCLDTATLAFGQVTPWAPLDSFFGSGAGAAGPSAELRRTLASMRAGSFELWVTHQVNITALTGASVAMGEAVLVDAGGRVIARLGFS